MHCNFFKAWTAVGFIFLCSLSNSLCSPALHKGAQIRSLLQARSDQNDVVEITKNNREDFPNLLEGAKDGSQIVISVSELILHKLVEIKTAITLRGKNPENRPQIICKGDGGIVVSAEGVVLEDYILSGCKGPAIQINNPAFADPFADPASLVDVPFHRVQITNVDFFDNRDEENGFHADGGAIGISSGSNVTVTSCLFRNNYAQLGAGIHTQSRAVLQVINSTFEGNRARISGAGISTTAYHSVEGSPETSFLVSGCNFIGNKDEDGAADTSGLLLQGVGSSLEASEFLRFGVPQASGGGIYVSGFDKVSIVNSLFDSNSAVPAGGALFVVDNKAVHLRDNKFRNNFVTSPSADSPNPDLELGGAIYIAFVDHKSKLTIDNCVFENNTAAYGGGLHVVTPLTTQPMITNTVFRDNVGYVGGGGVLLRNTIQANVENMKMFNNRAAAGGGLMLSNGAGISFIQGSRDTLNSVFENNTAYDGGAWFFLGAGQVNTQAVSLDDNHAIRNGGAVYLSESLASGHVGLQDLNCRHNTAKRGGCIFMNNIASLGILNSRGGVNFFEGNKANAGGALYLLPSSQVSNNIMLAACEFIENKALLNYEEEQPEIDIPRLAIEDAGQEARDLHGDQWGRRGSVVGLVISSSSLIEADGDDPCLPGGGGAICFGLNAIPERANVEVGISQSSFTRNAAMSGGALFIAADPQSSWVEDCPSMSSTLSSTPCRGLGIRSTTFLDNSAKGAGGAVFMTNAESAFIDTSAEELPPYSYVPLKDIAKRNYEGFSGNTVGFDGFGPHVGTGATVLDLQTTHGNSLIAEDHASGTKLPAIELVVMDAIGQSVSAGVSDSLIRVQAISENIAGQLVTVAEAGVATFDSITVTADPGTYEITFLANGLPPVTSSFSIRGCVLGEFNVTDKKICTSCSSGFYGHDPLVPCQQCSERAECTGGPVLVPKNGFWHSTPFSPQLHKCLSEDSCDYDGRIDKLMEFYSNRSALVPSDQPVGCDIYPQCGEGYQDVLCGSCSPGFGHFEGGECMKCKGKKLTVLFLSLAALWTLGLLGFTIRSSLSSIRDFNEMRTILARKTLGYKGNAQHPRTIAPAPVQPEPLPQFRGVTNADNVFYSGPNEPTQGTNASPERIPEAAVEAKSRELWSDAHNASIDHIIAAENLSETVKIAVNFLQVTSVAIAIHADWTEAIQNTLAIQDLLAGFSNGASLVALDCVLDDKDDVPRSIRALVFRIAFPMLLLVIIVAIFFLYWLRLYRLRGESIAYFRSRTIISFLVVLFFAYEFITQELMRTLNCVGIDVVDESVVEDPYAKYSIARGTYWGEDTSLKCYEGSHARLAGALGGPGLVVFSIGIPFFLLIFLLWNKENDRLNDQAFLNTYGFIFQNYRERYVYWEVAIMFRKALVGGIVVFAYPLGPNLQGVFALGVLIVSLVLHLVALPYKYKMLNVLEGASLVVSIFMFYSGIVFNDTNTSNIARVFLSTLLVLLNFGLVILFVVIGFQQVNKFVAAKLHCLGTSVPKGFIARVYKFCTVVVSRAAVQAQEQSKNHPLVKGMSQSIRSIQTHSARLGKTVSRRMGKLGSTSGRSLGSNRSSRSMDSHASTSVMEPGLPGGGRSMKSPPDLGGIPEVLTTTN